MKNLKPLPVPAHPTGGRQAGKIPIPKLSIVKIGIIVFLFTAQHFDSAQCGSSFDKLSTNDEHSRMHSKCGESIEPLLFAQEDVPEKIISLGPSITKELYLLRVHEKLIANTVYCTDPPEAKKKEKVGTAQKVNIEKVFNLKPDLVLATSLVDPRSTEKLKNLGLRVVTFSTPRDFNDICKQFLELGRLVGKEKEAKEIVRKAENEANLVREKVKNLYKSKVLIEVGTRPLVVATGNYFVNDYIEFAGGINIAKDAKEGIYSREQVLKANPDVIIITTMGIATEEEKRIWQKYEILNAVKNNQIYIIDTDKITSPTPQSFVKTIKEFVHILHPGK